MKKLIIFIIVLCAAITGNAQNYLDHIQQKQQGSGSVTVTQNKEIDELVNGKPQQESETTKTETTKKNVTTPNSEETTEAEVDMNKKVMRSSHKVTGYRVQAYAGGNTRADKQKAEQIKNAIKAHFPDQPVYVHFYSPRWICRVGNYRTMEEATEMLHKIRALGYSQASIVKGQITVPN